MLGAGIKVTSLQRYLLTVYLLEQHLVEPNKAEMAIHAPPSSHVTSFFVGVPFGSPVPVGHRSPYVSTMIAV